MKLDLIAETRPNRLRLWGYVRGDDSAYRLPGTVYGGEPFTTFNDALFRHDLHVTLYVANEALGAVKADAWQNKQEAR